MTTRSVERTSYFNFDIKTIAAFCSILVFAGGIIISIAKSSQAETNSGQDLKIENLDVRTANIEKELALQHQDMKDNNTQVNAKIDALLNAMGVNPATVIAKAKQQ